MRKSLFDTLGSGSITDNALDTTRYFVYNFIADDAIYGTRIENPEATIDSSQIEHRFAYINNKSNGVRFVKADASPSHDVETEIEIDQLAQVLWDDELINNDYSRFSLQIVKKSNNSPDVYVSFSWMEKIKSLEMHLYADYMFDQVEMEDYDDIGDDGFGMAELYNGEGLWISKEDYEQLSVAVI